MMEQIISLGCGRQNSSYSSSQISALGSPAVWWDGGLGTPVGSAGRGQLAVVRYHVQYSTAVLQ